MKTKLVQRRWDNWPGEIRRRLMSLTTRDDSGMKAVIHARNCEVTFVLFEDDTPVAWALTEFDEHDGHYNIMLYVRRDRRRHGYGTRLFKRAKKWVERQGADVFVFHDFENNAFFKTVGVGLDDEDSLFC